MALNLHFDGLRADECEIILEVLQKDLLLQHMEQQRIWKIKEKLNDLNQKSKLLTIENSFNDTSCLNCFNKFLPLFRQKQTCYLCGYYYCKNCTDISSNGEIVYCFICIEKERYAKQSLDWFYEQFRSKFKRSGSSKIIRDLCLQKFGTYTKLDCDKNDSQTRNYYASDEPNYSSNLNAKNGGETILELYENNNLMDRIKDNPMDKVTDKCIKIVSGDEINKEIMTLSQKLAETQGLYMNTTAKMQNSANTMIEFENELNKMDERLKFYDEDIVDINKSSLESVAIDLGKITDSALSILNSANLYLNEVILRPAESKSSSSIEEKYLDHCYNNLKIDANQLVQKISQPKYTYNINDHDFDDVIQKESGSDIHDELSIGISDMRNVEYISDFNDLFKTYTDNYTLMYSPNQNRIDNTNHQIENVPNNMNDYRFAIVNNSCNILIDDNNIHQQNEKIEELNSINEVVVNNALVNIMNNYNNNNNNTYVNSNSHDINSDNCIKDIININKEKEEIILDNFDNSQFSIDQSSQNSVKIEVMRDISTDLELNELDYVLVDDKDFNGVENSSIKDAHINQEVLNWLKTLNISLNDGQPEYNCNEIEQLKLEIESNPPAADSLIEGIKINEIKNKISNSMKGILKHLEENIYLAANNVYGLELVMDNLTQNLLTNDNLSLKDAYSLNRLDNQSEDLENKIATIASKIEYSEHQIKNCIVEVCEKMK